MEREYLGKAGVLFHLPSRNKKQKKEVTREWEVKRVRHQILAIKYLLCNLFASFPSQGFLSFFSGKLQTMQCNLPERVKGEKGNVSLSSFLPVDELHPS